jgi:hypothetical protein
MDYREKVRDLISALDLSSDEGRNEAMRVCIEYASKHLYGTSDCNPFLAKAADVIGYEQKVFFDSIKEMTEFEGAEKIHIVSDDSGFTITSNKHGLRYLSRLLANLSKSDLPGEHIHLDPPSFPLTVRSAAGIFTVQDEEWFANEIVAPQHGKNEMVYPAINPHTVVAISFNHCAPADEDMTPGKLYKVLRVEPWHEQTWIFHFIDDAGRYQELGVNLDDPWTFFLTRDELDKITGDIRYQTESD